MFDSIKWSALSVASPPDKFSTMPKKPPRRPGRVPINHPSSDDGNDGDDRSDPEEVLANFGSGLGRGVGRGRGDARNRGGSRPPLKKPRRSGKVRADAAETLDGELTDLDAQAMFSLAMLCVSLFHNSCMYAREMCVYVNVIA